MLKRFKRPWLLGGIGGIIYFFIIYFLDIIFCQIFPSYCSGATNPVILLFNFPPFLISNYLGFGSWGALVINFIMGAVMGALASFGAKKYRARKL